MSVRDRRLQSALKRPLRVGIVGMGGFAGMHQEAIQLLETQRLCTLICTCDPDTAAFKDNMSLWKYGERHVQVYDTFDAMLSACAADLDVVTLPTPIPLHAPMHQASVERGLAVYLEKPPTLDYAEFEHMLSVEQTAKYATNVGFNFILEAPRRQLKARILAGEFGRLRKVCFSGMWPRARSYFERARWAGKLMLDGRLVLDSCLGNAMAHYVHNVLHWAGIHGVDDWADVTSVTAELYRAHKIEGAGTFFIRAMTDSDVELDLALTHACSGGHRHTEWIECEHATINYVTSSHYEIVWKNGNRENTPVPPVTLADNFTDYFHYLLGERERPSTRLSDARSFVMINDLAYIAADRITSVQTPYSYACATGDQRSEYVVIDDLDEAFRAFFSSGLFPSAAGFPWARGGGNAIPAQISSLPNVVRHMTEHEQETRNHV